MRPPSILACRLWSLALHQHWPCECLRTLWFPHILRLQRWLPTLHDREEWLWCGWVHWSEDWTKSDPVWCLLSYSFIKNVCPSSWEKTSNVSPSRWTVRVSNVAPKSSKVCQSVILQSPSPLLGMSSQPCSVSASSVLSAFPAKLFLVIGINLMSVWLFIFIFMRLV